MYDSLHTANIVTLEKAGTDEYPTLNFAKALALYAKNFIRTSTSTSFEYLALITISNDLPQQKKKKHTTAAQEAVRELVIESRAFVTLLGDIRPDGTRESGIIEKKGKLLNVEGAAQREYIRSIVEKAATLVDDEGDTPSAVLLYHLSEDYSLVLATINRRLSDVFGDPSAPIYINDPVAQEESRNMNFSMAAVADPALLAKNVLTMYEANGNILQHLDTNERETCKVLLGMIEARKSFLNGRWETSISVNSYLSLIPDHRGSRFNSIVWVAIYA
jgi:nuclear pore complex protein Nup93